jgi:Na+/melibiose symporter-like transporter
MGLIVTTAACFLTKESETDVAIEEDSDISTSVENYEIEQRRLAIQMGEDPREVRNREIPKRDGFCYGLKKNCQAIGRAIKMREIYSLVIFFIAYGILSPKFDDFTYFFLLNVIGISKFIFALLALIGQICHIIGAILYKTFFRGTDTRTMILIAMICSCVFGFLNFSFAKRWN